MADIGIQIIASQRSDGKFDLALEMQGIEPVLLQGEVESPEGALRLIYDALTAPLAEAEKLKFCVDTMRWAVLDQGILDLCKKVKAL